LKRYAVLTLLIAGCGNSHPGKEIPANLRYKVFQADSGWGYSIFIQDSLYIDQPTIPAIEGNKHFHSSADADKTAQFVIKKIERNIIPPLLSIEELDSLEIKY
jgi:hypothetical protein